ncbi:MAG: sulfite exporter TauE/SafE family protein [Candidatus Rokubacteria bacterium]|nr:sulfite exporter TauE/SafE family protein [Candidatus Rokubacteria bacterium]
MERVLLIGFGGAIGTVRSEPVGGRESRPTVMLGVGFGVGLLTGFLGIGGGFVIVPALLWAGRLPMKVAIGTSLTAIALSSAAGRPIPRRGSGSGASFPNTGAGTRK